MPICKNRARNGPDGSVVAETIYHAVTDDSWKMRYRQLARDTFGKALLPDAIFLPIVRRAVVKYFCDTTILQASRLDISARETNPGTDHF